MGSRSADRRDARLLRDRGERGSAVPRDPRDVRQRLGDAGGITIGTGYAGTLRGIVEGDGAAQAGAGAGDQNPFPIHIHKMPARCNASPDSQISIIPSLCGILHICRKPGARDVVMASGRKYPFISALPSDVIISK